MSTRKSVGKNYIYNIIYEIITLLVPLITTPYISRVLGAEGIGTYSYTNSIAAYFSYFAALGTTVYTRREIAYLQDDRKKRTKLFWEIIVLRVILTAVSLTAYCVYAAYRSFDVITIVQGLNILIIVTDITWLYQGMENFGIIVLRNILLKIVSVIFIFTCVLSSDDLIIYVLGATIFSILGNISLWYSAKKFIGNPSGLKLQPFRHLKGSFALFIPTIASQVYWLLDKTMIGIFAVGSAENGYYEQAQKIIRICWTFVTTFATVMTPRIAFSYAKRQMGDVRYYMKQSFRFVWFLAMPISLGVIGVSKNLVPWFFGDGFGSVETLLYIFSFIVLPLGLNSVTGSQYLVATKRQNIFTLSIVIGAIVNFTANIILIPRYLAIGAAYSSVLAEAVIAIVQAIYIVVVVKEFRVRDIFFKCHKYVISSVIMLIVVFAIGKEMASTMRNTLLLVVTGGAIYCGSLFIMKDELFQQYFTLLLEKIKKISQGIKMGE